MSRERDPVTVEHLAAQFRTDMLLAIGALRTGNSSVQRIGQSLRDALPLVDGLMSLALKHPAEARELIAAACGVEPGEAITAAPIAVESAARDVVYAWQKWANRGAAGNVDPDALPRAMAALAAALGDAP